MSSEAVAAGAAASTAPFGAAPAGRRGKAARLPLRVGSAFDPYIGAPRPADDPGARQAGWTVAAMLRPELRDLLAIAQTPPDLLMIGAAEGWLALQLLGWGAGTVTVVDARAERLRRLLQLAEATAADPSGGHLWAIPNLSHARIERWQLGLLDGRDGMPGGRPAALAGAADRCEAVILLSDRPREARDDLAEAGLERPRLLRPPADAERRLVKAEWALIKASRADAG